MTGELQKVVISRYDPFFNADERIYAHGNFSTTNIDNAQRFDRHEAEALLKRGRWQGLDPKIEPAPTKEEAA